MFLLRSYSDVRDANVMRMILKGNNYESRIDYTYRDPKRGAEKRRILFPNLQRAANLAAVPEEMGGYTGKEGGKRTIHRTIWKERPA